MRLHVLVEGPSEAHLLVPWLRRLLPSHPAAVIPHRGKGKLPGDPTKPPPPQKQGLLDQLPAKLRAFGKALDPKTDRLVVLVDADHDDCRVLQKQLLKRCPEIA
jgi:hypothetical protein